MKLTVEEHRSYDGPYEAPDLLDEAAATDGADRLTRNDLNRIIAHIAHETVDYDDLLDDCWATTVDRTVTVTVDDAEWPTWAEMVGVPSRTPGAGQRDIFGGEHQ